MTEAELPTFACHELGHAITQGWRGATVRFVKQGDGVIVCAPDPVAPPGSVSGWAETAAGPLAELLLFAGFDALKVQHDLQADGMRAFDQCRHARFDMEELAGAPPAFVLWLAGKIVEALALELREVPVSVLWKLDDALRGLREGETLKLA